MMTKTSAENVRQYKSGYPLIVEWILNFLSSTNFVRKVKNMFPNFKKMQAIVWIERSILSSNFASVITHYAEIDLCTVVIEPVSFYFSYGFLMFSGM